MLYLLIYTGPCEWAVTIETTTYNQSCDLLVEIIMLDQSLKRWNNLKLFQ